MGVILVLIQLRIPHCFVRGGRAAGAARRAVCRLQVGVASLYRASRTRTLPRAAWTRPCHNVPPVAALYDIVLRECARRAAIYPLSESSNQSYASSILHRIGHCDWNLVLIMPSITSLFAALSHMNGTKSGNFLPLQACPIVNQQKLQPSWIPPTSFAASAAAVATQYRKGTILVIGANEGKLGNDPSFQVIASKQANHLHKVFVEPVPYLYRQLETNIKSIPHARAVQVAVSNQSGTMKMFCFAMDPDKGPPAQWPEALRKKARFDSAKREGRGWWSQICSLSRDRLFNVDDMGHDFRNARETLAPFVTSTNVKVVTVDELLDTVRLPVRQ